MRWNKEKGRWGIHFSLSLWFIIKQNYESTLQHRATFTSSFASFSNGNESSAEFPNEPDLHRTPAFKNFTLKNNLHLLFLLNKTGSV